MRSALPVAVVTLVLVEIANGKAYAASAAHLGFSTVAACALAMAALAWHLRPQLPRVPPRALVALPVAAGAYALAVRGLLQPGPLGGRRALPSLGRVYHQRGQVAGGVTTQRGRPAPSPRPWLATLPPAPGGPAQHTPAVQPLVRVNVPVTL